MSLDVKLFKLESPNANGKCSDRLRVKGVDYCGSKGPEGITLAKGNTILFESGPKVRRDGFKICAELATSPPPSPLPSPPPSPPADDRLDSYFERLWGHLERLTAEHQLIMDKLGISAGSGASGNEA
jgi:hypothetical protein